MRAAIHTCAYSKVRKSTGKHYRNWRISYQSAYILSIGASVGRFHLYPIENRVVVMLPPPLISGERELLEWQEDTSHIQCVDVTKTLLTPDTIEILRECDKAATDVLMKHKEVARRIAQVRNLL